MLIVRNEAPSTVFDLIGRDENSATFALGWALERCPCFAERFIRHISGELVPIDSMQLRLQRSGQDGGFTDIEVRCGEVFEAIIEAKVGDQLPSLEQLSRYLPRLQGSQARIRKMISVSALSSDVAQLTLPLGLGLPVEHLSWGAISTIAHESKRHTRHAEQKLWLEHLTKHLENYVAMDRANSNLVYVVSLGGSLIRSDGAHTWIDVVEKDRRYFHPIRNHWPKEPPNYIGFRYRGALQSVHRIESYEIVNDLEAVNPLWPREEGPQYVYSLGPAMRPPRLLRAGTPGDSVVRSMRVTCQIDTLLSGQFDLLGQAHAESNRRRLATRAEGMDRIGIADQFEEA